MPASFITDHRRIRRFLIALSIVICTLQVAIPLHALTKKLVPYKDKYVNTKIHPYTHLLKGPESSKQLQSKSNNYEKLLVILVDFQEEDVDDPNTSGNGKFQLTPDPTYLYSVGAPPHDREYFETNLEAMKYYYRAVSAESYQLQYDVWPKNKPAYTLPQKMGYYNPPNASSTLFVSRMEEYFKTAFETADADDPAIDFGAYAHYMIIHAGSDWQHDSLGDTPSDIPSFFIRVGDGKQAIVDNGATEIFHACNVPSTISQDFKIEEHADGNLHTGYGALNAVLFHEFGHSLGLVDLYNVRNFYPMVGAFDIMDSGGAGLIMDILPGNGYVLLEGALPSLPGAFSRALLFEDYFRQQGFMKDIDEFQTNTPVSLAASSFKQAAGTIPSIIKIPISKDEYYLIENRSIDPDGDGDTSVLGALDGRVILYPTPYGSPSNAPSYEYDYLLPSFITDSGRVEGGGILAWHVNERILYQEGKTDSGVFRSNFDLNTVNTNVNRRGVRVLEADGLPDLGEMYSMYWTGTPYEYFHATKPSLDSLGFFVQWSTDAWRPVLSGNSKPTMLDSNGIGTYMALAEITNPAAIMQFKILPGLFDNAFSHDYSSTALQAAPIINTAYSNLSVPVYKTANMNLWSAFGNEWQDLMGSYDLPEFSFDYPLVSADSYNDGFSELIGVKGNGLYIMDFADSFLNSQSIVFPEPIVSIPIGANDALYVNSETTLYKIQNAEITDFTSLPGIKAMAICENTLFALQKNRLTIIDISDFVDQIHKNLPEEFGDYEPVIYKSDGGEQHVFITANSGSVYSYDGDAFRKIFSNGSVAKPTQLAVIETPQTAPLIFFGIDNKAYAISANGSLQSGFPVDLGASKVHSGRHCKALDLDNSQYLYLPMEEQGYLAIDLNARISIPNSLIYKHTGKQDYLYYDETNHRLLWYYPTASGMLHINSKTGFTENPILWQGFRNGNSGVNSGAWRNQQLSNTKLNAYVYPNPVQSRTFRLRMENANPKTIVSIFDISGVRIQKHLLDADSATVRELELDADRLSSGVYMISIQSGKQAKTIKFAVEK